MKKLIFLLPVILMGVLVLTSWQSGKQNEKGKELYDTYCLTCHMADGKGVPGLNPPLDKTSNVSGNKTKLIQLMLKGTLSNDEKGNDKYPNAMAPYDYLTDQEMAAVISYIRASFGNKASAVTAAEVKSARAKTK